MAVRPQRRMIPELGGPGQGARRGPGGPPHIYRGAVARCYRLIRSGTLTSSGSPGFVSQWYIV